MKEVIAPQTHFLIFKLFHWTFVPLSLSGFDEHPSVQKLSDGSYHRYNRYCCHLRFFHLCHLSDVDIPLLPHSHTPSPTNAVFPQPTTSFLLHSERKVCFTNIVTMLAMQYDQDLRFSVTALVSV